VRSYDEYCSLARSLDVVGDRWTLLVVRELTLRGPSRYTDLRAGLPGIATNLLADRLRELEQAGVVEREEAPPPVATTLFRLTARGERLRPALEALARWGMPLMAEQKPTDAVRSHWVAWALESLLRDHEPDGPPVSVELRTGDQPIAIATRDGGLDVRLGSAENPDAIVTGEPRPVLGVMFGLQDAAAAGAAGVKIEGRPEVLERIRPTATELAAVF
jgi:DNA-binding HxlR family transcriptional regulator